MPEIIELANELKKISHNMRSALAVLRVGSQVLASDSSDDVEVVSAMKIKVGEIDKYCDRLKEISDVLKSA